MKIEVPEGARAAARIVMLDAQNRLLYLHAREESTGREFWVMPGGGVEEGETFEQAAKREAWEETGIDIEVGPCLWTRHHVFEWEGKPHSQFEVFFLARIADNEVSPPSPDSYVFEHRWWTISELQSSEESFAPRRIGALINDILNGNIPAEPFECGV